MIKSPLLADVYSAPQEELVFQFHNNTKHVSVVDRLPPPPPPKTTSGVPPLPPKPKNLVDSMRKANKAPRIQFYEELCESDIAVGQEVPCRVEISDITPIVGVTLPTPKIDFPVITKDEAIESFKEYVTTNCCWEHRFLSTLRISDDEMVYCYIIQLDNFYESRTAYWREVPSTNKTLLTPYQGSAPAPWKVFISPSPIFEDHIETISIPFTDIERKCVDCSETGRLSCSQCSGFGSIPCQTCQKHISLDKSDCPICLGSSSIPCRTCNGIGTVVCNHCHGHLSLTQSIELKSTFETHSLTNIIEKGGLHFEYLRHLKGIEIYCVTANHFIESHSFYDHNVTNIINDLLKQSFELENRYEVICHQQRIHVSIVPVRILHCESEQHSFDVSVFDIDRKIYCPNYPNQKCGLWNNIKERCTVI